MTRKNRKKLVKIIWIIITIIIGLSTILFISGAHLIGSGGGGYYY